ncbi:MAG: ribose transport system ATP-binding protein [Halanaerobiales bacterium]|nr:ribose transport system ATP-binding protein [Halanaerobiales bacterium]
MNALEIKNLTAFNTDGYFIRDINLILKKGEIQALIGENGSGKKTFIESLMGFINDITGKIIYESRNISLDHSFHGLKGVSFIEQVPNLVDKLSVAENINLLNYSRMGIFSIINWKKVNKNAKNLLEKFGIELDPQKLIKDLSREEKKIV